MEPEGSSPYTQEPATCPYLFEHIVHKYMYVTVHFGMAVPSSSKYVGSFLATWKYYTTWKLYNAILEFYKCTFSSSVCVCVLFVR
jgi:hypothetical protein